MNRRLTIVTLFSLAGLGCSTDTTVVCSGGESSGTGTNGGGSSGTGTTATALGTMEVALFTSAAWPAPAKSALIRFTRVGGETGCAGGAAWLRGCWCVEPGSGCDFAGDPPVSGTIKGLCPGEWRLESSSTALFEETGCLLNKPLVTREQTTPSAVQVKAGDTSKVNVTFEGSSTVLVKVGFDG